MFNSVKISQLPLFTDTLRLNTEIIVNREGRTYRAYLSSVESFTSYLTSGEALTEVNPWVTNVDTKSLGLFSIPTTSLLGTNNFFAGNQAGFQSTIQATDNIFMGFQSGYSNVAGKNNIFLGRSSGGVNSFGNNNIYVGRLAGQSNTIGSNNIFIGDNTDSTLSNLSGVIAIGTNVDATESYQLALSTQKVSIVSNNKTINFGSQQNSNNVNVYGETTTNTLKVTLSADLPFIDTLSASNIFVTNSSSNIPSLKLTQIGLGPVLLVEDTVDDGTPFIVNTHGQVGIGTLEPNEQLTVIGNISATGTTFLSAVDVNTNIIVNDSIAHKNNLDTKLSFPATNTVTIETSGLERLRINNQGNVGIGEPSPQYKLDIAAPAARIASTSNLSGYGVLQFGRSATTANNWHIGSEGDGTFRIYNGDYGLGSERIRINSSGNTGIGTSDTTEKLVVAGNILSYGNLSVTGNLSSAKNLQTNAAQFISLSSDIDTGVHFRSFPLIERSLMGINNRANLVTNIDIKGGNIWYFNLPSTASWVHNIRVSDTIPLSSVMGIGDTVVVTVFSRQNSFNNFTTACRVDGLDYGTLWYTGVIPPSGSTVTGFDVYTWTIVKVTSADTFGLPNQFNVFGMQSRYG
jgi:hypothetical protein